MGKAIVKGKTKAKVKKAPVKAGRTHTSTTGGIMTTKVVAIAKKKKNKGV